MIGSPINRTIANAVGKKNQKIVVCHKNCILFCFKYVSDRANENATEDWKKNVSDGGEAFGILLNSLNG